MAGVKISALPAIVTPALTDVFPVVQAGVTYKETITQLGTLVLLLSGGTMTGNLILNADPSAALQAATKQYVDSVATGLNIQAPCRVATTANLTVTYANGASGVGATLTNAGAMAALSIDGVALSAGNRVLVKDQSSQLQNGIYTVTTVGSGAVNWVMTRATDFDTPAEIQPGDYVLVLEGTTNASTSYVQTATVAAVGVDAIVWNQFSGDVNTLITNIQNSAYNYAEDTGAADAYVATLNPPITTYVEGLLVILDPDNANTSATPTLNVNGLGVKTITNNLGGALVAGDIVASQRLYLLYDGTNFRLLNRNYEKRIQNESFNYILDTGAADAYVATLVPAVSAYVTGQRLSLKIANTNATTTPTVNVNALGAKTIVHSNGSALLAGDLLAGMIADLRYDGTNYQLLNPARLIGKVLIQTFTGSGTYTPTAFMSYCTIEAVGAGAGGGGAALSTGAGGAGGGGSGAYSRITVPAATIGASQTVTIGAGGAGGAAGNNNGVAGGNTSVGTICVANGGALGAGAAANGKGSGGAGGTAGTGDITPVGNGGSSGGSSNTSPIGAMAGQGGASFFGGAPAGFCADVASGGGGGANGGNYGAGGNGGSSANSSAAAAGGTGSNGLVIITEYIAV